VGTTSICGFWWMGFLWRAISEAINQSIELFTPHHIML
jgi:hypothetical protein